MINTSTGNHRVRQRLLLLLICIILFLLAVRSPNIITRIWNPSPLTLNIKNAGAKGDGMTDDTNIFIQVLQEAGNHNGGLVIIPPGTYRIDPKEPLPLSSNVHIQGIGQPILDSTLRPQSVMDMRPSWYLAARLP